jgi:hypothetical protein
MAVASDRLDLKLSSDDKQLLIQAAAIEGLSSATCPLNRDNPSALGRQKAGPRGHPAGA